MSTGIVAIDTPPRMAMSTAMTTNVYGRRSASLTIHMGAWRLWIAFGRRDWRQVAMSANVCVMGPQGHEIDLREAAPGP